MRNLEAAFARIKYTAALAVVGLSMASCAPEAASPTSTRIPTATPRPTETATPTPTKTPEPAATLAPTEIPTPTIEQEPAASYEKDIVNKMYEMNDGRRIEDIQVDPQIMEVMRSLNIEAHGDITNLLIQAIPVDNANAHDFPDTLGIHLTPEYIPVDLIENVKDFGIECYLYLPIDEETREMEVIQINREVAQAFLALQHEAFARNMPLYVRFGFRDAKDQERLTQVRGSGAAKPYNSEHMTGRVLDVYASNTKHLYPSMAYTESAFHDLINAYGFVSSVGFWGDSPHILYIGIAEVRALLDAGINPNSRPVVAQVQIAKYQILVSQANAK